MFLGESDIPDKEFVVSCSGCLSGAHRALLKPFVLRLFEFEDTIVPAQVKSQISE